MKTQKPFDIQAKTCTLLGNDNTEALLSPERKLNVPVYQRAYSWEEKHVHSLMNDLLLSFGSHDGEPEPMFIGSMQLSAKDDNGTQDIIDGQQRVSTILLLVKVLQAKTGIETYSYLKDTIISSVNVGQQEADFKASLEEDIDASPIPQNRYSANLYLINTIVGKWNEDAEQDIDLKAFLHYTLHQVYFVVIETQAGLSKTLKIFDSINTQGMDLAGADLFKIRMYEYLNRQDENPQIFEQINRLYKKVEDYNKELKGDFGGMQYILSVYQRILIAANKLPRPLYDYNMDTFFDRMFDTLLGIQQWEHFKGNLREGILSLETIEQVIEACYFWEATDYSTAEAQCAMNFIWWSRYGRHANLIEIFLYRYREIQAIERWEALETFMKKLNKFVFSYSVRFAKSVYEANNFIYQLLETMMNNDCETVIAMLDVKMKNERHKASTLQALGGEIAYNHKLKNLVCRLSAMLQEDYKSLNEEKRKKIVHNLFGSNIDIEHVQPYHDIEAELREKIWQMWGHEINSLSNLVVFPSGKNRSQCNVPYSKKRAGYQESEYAIVKRLAEKHSEWTLDTAMAWKETQAKELMDYLFN